MKDKVKNDDIRKKTGLRKLQDIIKERRLRWLGHVIRIGGLQNTSPGYTVGVERIQEEARINWTDIVKRNLKNMNISWEEAKEL